jgi:hypothetical protein
MLASMHRRPGMWRQTHGGPHGTCQFFYELALMSDVSKINVLQLKGTSSGLSGSGVDMPWTGAALPAYPFPAGLTLPPTTVHMRQQESFFSTPFQTADIVVRGERATLLKAGAPQLAPPGTTPHPSSQDWYSWYALDSAQ